MNSALMLAALLAAAPGDRVLVDQIAAVVNDEVITLSDVKVAAKPYIQPGDAESRKQLLYKDILRQLIDERLLSQQIAEAKITVSEEETERAVKDILRQNKISREQLEEAIRSRGMTMGQYLQDLESQLIRLKLVDMKVRSRVVIPEADIKSEFDSRTRGEKKQEMVTIRHFLFLWSANAKQEERQRVLARAEAAKKRVLAGEDFAEVAKEVSQGPTAAQGGSLGELNLKELWPELRKVLEPMKPGDISPPVETTNGVHVVLLEGRRFKAPTSYSELRDRIYQELYQQRVEEQMKIWVEELRAASAIDVRLE